MKMARNNKGLGVKEVAEDQTGEGLGDRIMEEYSLTLEVDHEGQLEIADHVVVAAEDIPPVVLRLIILKYHL